MKINVICTVQTLTLFVAIHVNVHCDVWHGYIIYAIRIDDVCGITRPGDRTASRYETCTNDLSLIIGRAFVPMHRKRSMTSCFAY